MHWGLPAVWQLISPRFWSLRGVCRAPALPHTAAGQRASGKQFQRVPAQPAALSLLHRRLLAAPGSLAS